MKKKATAHRKTRKTLRARPKRHRRTHKTKQPRKRIAITPALRVRQHERLPPGCMNVGKIMRQYSDGANVSPSAVAAMMDRFDLFLERAMPRLAQIANAHGAKTIREDENLDKPEKSQAHVTWLFSIKGNTVDAIAAMENKKVRWQLVKNENKNETKQHGT